MSQPPKRIIVAITGASGAILGIRTLELLKEAGVETHLIISRAARQAGMDRMYFKRLMKKRGL